MIGWLGCYKIYVSIETIVIVWKAAKYFCGYGESKLTRIVNKSFFSIYSTPDNCKFWDLNVKNREELKKILN